MSDVRMVQCRRCLAMHPVGIFCSCVTDAEIDAYHRFVNGEVTDVIPVRKRT